MQITLKSLLITGCLFSSLSLIAQELTEIISTNDGYKINYLNDELEVYKTKEFVDDKVVAIKSYDPKTGFKKGEFFDGLNNYYYDDEYRINSDGEISIDITASYKSLDPEHRYDEVIAHGIELEKGLVRGLIKLVGYKYPYVQQYDPYGTYLMSHALGFKAPQYTYHRVKGSSPQSDTIGYVNINKSIYNGPCALELQNGKVIEWNSINGVPQYYKEIDRDGIETSFQIGQKTFKYKGELFLAPDTANPINSIVTYLNKLESTNSSEESVKRWKYFPQIITDPLGGQVSMELLPYVRDADPFHTSCLQYTVYTASGTYGSSLPENYEDTQQKYHGIFYGSLKPKFYLNNLSDYVEVKVNLCEEQILENSIGNISLNAKIIGGHFFHFISDKNITEEYKYVQVYRKNNVQGINLDFENLCWTKNKYIYSTEWPTLMRLVNYQFFPDSISHDTKLTKEGKIEFLQSLNTSSFLGVGTFSDYWLFKSGVTNKNQLNTDPYPHEVGLSVGDMFLLVQNTKGARTDISLKELAMPEQAPVIIKQKTKNQVISEYLNSLKVDSLNLEELEEIDE